MKKIVILIIMAICLSTLGFFGEDNLAEAKTTNPKMGNIKIVANDVNVRMDKSASSKIVGQVAMDDVYELLGEGKDSKGKVWYKIDIDFGVTGWVASWLCKKTNEEINRFIKSKPGELLYTCSNKGLFVELLLQEDYSLKNLLKIYGNPYRTYQERDSKIYEYENGIKLKVSEAGDVESVSVGEREFYPAGLQKKSCDIFKNKGNETIILDGTSLIIVDTSNKKILREYNTGYLYAEELEVGNFIGDSNLELYLHGNSDVYENGNYEIENSIYKVTNDDFIRVYDTDSFNFYSSGIKANINQNVLNLNIDIENYQVSEKSIIPDRVFYNTKTASDKNKLLYIYPQWSVVQENGKWYIKYRYTVNIVMLGYYWGPPDDNMEDNGFMYNDLARVDVVFDTSSKSPKIYKVLSEIKYNDDGLLNVKPMLEEEGSLPNGPALGMSMEEAYKALGGDLKSFKYSDYIELNGVGLSEFCNEIVDIYIESPEYETKRGLKVGDSIQKVESLYGKPDVGFSGDACVEYKFCNQTDGELKVNYYRTLTIYYKEGLVSAFELHQVILD